MIRRCRCCGFRGIDFQFREVIVDRHVFVPTYSEWLHVASHGVLIHEQEHVCYQCYTMYAAAVVKWKLHRMGV